MKEDDKMIFYMIKEWWFLIAFIIGVLYKSYQLLAKIINVLTEINFSIQHLSEETNEINRIIKEQWKEIFNNKNNITSLKYELLKIQNNLEHERNKLKL